MIPFSLILSTAFLWNRLGCGWQYAKVLSPPGFFRFFWVLRFVTRVYSPCWMLLEIIFPHLLTFHLRSGSFPEPISRRKSAAIPRHLLRFGLQGFFR